MMKILVDTNVIIDALTGREPFRETAEQIFMIAANQTEDMNPVPYGNFIGKVVYFLPGAGRAAELFTSSSGKILAGGVIAAALILQVLAAAIGAVKHDDTRR